MKSIGLYIHIPFCYKKCLYCDFNSYANKDIYEEPYIEALLKELNYYINQGKYTFKTVFIGGGTPTIINPENIERIIKAIEKNIEKDAEITIECNPGTVDEKKALLYKTVGINRISIGLQAWQDELLNIIGRMHDRKGFIESLNIFRKHGFDNINVDLMFSLPKQTLQMWEESLNNVCSLGVEHVSCYSLIVEEGTTIYQLIRSGQLSIPDDETDREMYRMAKEILETYGLKQYEISNYSREGFQCIHNLIYWNNEEYIGAGAGSHSKIDRVRYWNYRSIEEYIARLKNNELPVEDSENISTEEGLWETIMLGLRLNTGLFIPDINEKYSINFMEKYGDVLFKLNRYELIQISGDRIYLTDKGRDLSNTVFVEFME